MSDHADSDLRQRCEGRSPLPARLEPWMVDLAQEPAVLLDVLGDGEAPVNIIDPRPLVRNADELAKVAAAHQVDLGIFFARKANKCLSLVAAARDRGLGVDVSSLTELREVLDIGVSPDKVVLTASIKPRGLLTLALANRVTVVIDNPDELDVVGALVPDGAEPCPVALRLAIPIDDRPATRFGVPADQAAGMAEVIGRHPGLRLDGLHFHLDGYAAQDRVAGLDAALQLADTLTSRWHDLRFIDIGGGIPMSYLESADDWTEFWSAHRAGLLGTGPTLTHEDAGLGLSVVDGRVVGHAAVYPYFQAPVRGDWLDQVLRSQVSGHVTVAEAVSARGLQLRCEPGRSLLDGCGMTAALVHMVKRREGLPTLVGLGMNRTQCRSTSADFMLDPLLLPTGPSPRGPAESGLLVGAYCIERELITVRHLEFPDGIAVGDVVVIPNTAGYQMHILESSSHRMPLARNYVHDAGALSLDPVDAVAGPTA